MSVATLGSSNKVVGCFAGSDMTIVSFIRDKLLPASASIAGEDTESAEDTGLGGFVVNSCPLAGSIKDGADSGPPVIASAIDAACVPAWN